MIVEEKTADKELHSKIESANKKVITKTKRYAAQDIEFNAAPGDVVKIRQTRPISKTVSWAITDILEKSST